MGVEMNANLVGQNLGPYRIIEQIGQGGMATVYKAYEPALDRYVAIKVLPQYFAHDPSFSARFDREAKAVARLNHPNILPIYSFGQESGLSYIAMRYVGEGTLKDRLGQPLDRESAVDILRQIGQALDYAHHQGIIHRDVKPSNVLIAAAPSQAPGGGNWILLADFGLARMVESSSQLTKSGVGVGTPAYMSPEQGQGTRVDARSDLYSLGVVLYEMLTGRVPYEAETPMAVVLKHITAPLPMPRSLNPALPDAAERVILKAMAKTPEDRFQTAQEMVEALERALEDAAALEWLSEKEPEAGPALPLQAGTPTEAQIVQAPPVEVLPVEERPARVPFMKRVPLWAWGAIGLFVVLAAVGGALIATGGWPRPGGQEQAVPTDTPAKAERWVFIEPCEGVVPWQICVRDEESGEVIQVTHDLDFEEPGRTTWSPGGEQIVFNASGGHDHDLYVIHADGAGLRRITEGETTDLDPSWSPDGEWIAFHRDCGLWLVRPDGTGAHELLAASDDLCAGSTSWSPDSQRIAFADWHAEDDVHEIWVTGRDGSDPHVVYAFQRAVGWILVTWSPDDDLLACIYGTEDWTEGFVLDFKNDEPERLEKDELPWHWLSYYRVWEAEWAAPEPPPAGPERLVSIEPCEGVVPWQICVRDHESDEVIQVTHDLDFEEPGAAAWSPDGEQIVLNAGSGPADAGQYDHDLYVIDADGAGLRQITEGETTDLDPSWSPDGEWIAFHRDCGLWLVHPDGTGAHELLAESDDLCAGGTSWSPDSQRIVFVNWHAEDDVHEIWVVGRDGSDPHVVYAFQRVVDWIVPAWSPDDDLLACIYAGVGWTEGFVLDPKGGEPRLVPEDELPWHWLPNHRL